MLGVSRAAVTKRCASSWSVACDGDRIDATHAVILEAFAARGIAPPASAVPARAPTEQAKPAAALPPAPTVVAKTFKSRGPKPTRDIPDDDAPELPQPANAGTLEDLDTLGRLAQPLIDRFGSARAARDWVIFQKDRETTIGRRLANAQLRSEVIPRDFVRTHVIGLIDGVNHRLLSDIPKTLCRQLYSLARSGAPVEDAEKMIRQLLGKQLSGLKRLTEKALLHGIDRGNDERPDLARGAGSVADDRDGSDEALGMG